jgi:hypothetical protein
MITARQLFEKGYDLVWVVWVGTLHTRGTWVDLPGHGRPRAHEEHWLPNC